MQHKIHLEIDLHVSSTKLGASQIKVVEQGEFIHWENLHYYISHLRSLQVCYAYMNWKSIDQTTQ